MSEPLAPVPNSEYRKLPSVDALLQQPALQQLVARYSLATITDVIRDSLEEARAHIRHGQAAPPAESWSDRIEQRVVRSLQPTLRPVINATGVIIHTNLGRAPLSAAARAAINDLSAGYNNLEYDLEAGERGSRYSHTRSLLCNLTGAEDALVVNNNASAIYLVLAALCAGKEVIVSRGQLVEIGGGFRIPDVLRQSGATLVEVGTTNRTHPHDFVDAIGPDTAGLMRIHASNFRQLGFVTMPELSDLVTIAHNQPEGERPWVIDDLGSGTLLETAPFGLMPEPTIQASVAAGADVITFSGDKLLGGPQAGIIIGSSKALSKLRRHPLARALRVDKLTLAALEATLRTYAAGRALDEIPVWQMIAATPAKIQARAEQWQLQLNRAGVVSEIVESASTVGGGSLPGETLPTYCLALDLPHPDRIAANLRAGAPPVVCTIQQNRLLFDPRTVLPADEEALVSALVAVAHSA